MIQRKQTLFLLQLLLLGLVLIFVPCGKAYAGGAETDIFLAPLQTVHLQSSAGHWAAIAINYTALALSLIAIFLYRKLGLQRTICLVLTFLWLVLTLMIAFCPFIEAGETPVETSVNYYAVIIGILGTLGGLLAARFIKRDIELLKSAERIR